MIPEIIFLFLTLQNTEANSQSNERGCLYRDISDQFDECVRTYSNGLNLDSVMAELMETDFTGEDLLFWLSSICRNEQVLNAYRNCTNRAIATCPHLASVITNDVNETLSVFCEQGSPSAWLKTILQNGFLHKQNCTEDRIGNEVLIMVSECGTGFKIYWSGVTVDWAISTLQTLIQQLFQCLIDNGPSLPDQDGDGVMDCGSSWQDIVLAYALRLSSVKEFGWKIGEQEINDLQAIRTDWIQRADYPYGFY